jgi:myo-inositol-1(or 4)-monophosphatase
LEKVLLEATERVQEKVASITREGRRGETVGVGASGDKTLLADKVAEDEILAALSSVGGVRVLSEEAGRSGDPGAGSLAVIDPLDGSSNFERGIPFYCTSIALVDGETLNGVTFGIVRDLVSGDVYAARRGKGATKNGRPIRTTTITSPSKATAGVDLSGAPRELVAQHGPLVSGLKRTVHFGANALEICYLADGRVDAFVDIRRKIRITDFAAAYLIATEAGATFSDENGNGLEVSFDLNRRFSFVASANGGLHKEILRLARKQP